MLRGQVWLLVLWMAGCGAQRLSAGRFPAESIEVPAKVGQYQTEPQPHGARGGPELEQLARGIAAALAERGENARLDGALAATASWGLDQVHRGRSVDLIGAESASRQFGFGGVVLVFMAFETHHEATWREQIERTPKNVPITRYGISLSPSGQSAAVVLGNVELSYAPIPRSFAPGDNVTLKGEVGRRFTSCHLYLTKPDGRVVERHVDGRAFNETFPLPNAGKYRLEVMGDGATGPVVASNVPLYVGIEEPEAVGVTGTVVTPAEAEPRMLALLNEARRQAGLRPLMPDAELRAIALAHSEDMMSHGFFGHVSPTTGGPAERARQAGVLVSMFGENVALAGTPEVAHEGLMSSPGHRANMLRAEFTHVGIGAGKGDNGLVVTMAFGRRPPSSALPTGAPAIEAAIIELRAKQQLPPARPDPIYRSGAQAGADAAAAEADATAVGLAIQSAMQREVNRLHTSRSGGCTQSLELLELAQLDEITTLTQPGLRRFGVGAKLRDDAKGRRLSTVLMLEGASCE
jgi:uncharacterized protein YkwD